MAVREFSLEGLDEETKRLKIGRVFVEDTPQGQLLFFENGKVKPITSPYTDNPSTTFNQDLRQVLIEHYHEFPFTWLYAAVYQYVNLTSMIVNKLFL